MRRPEDSSAGIDRFPRTLSALELALALLIALSALASWPFRLDKEAKIILTTMASILAVSGASLQLPFLSRWASAHKKVISVALSWLLILSAGLFAGEMYVRVTRGYIAWDQPVRAFSQLEKLRIYNRKFYSEHLPYFQGFPMRVPLFEAPTHAPHYLFKRNLRMASRGRLLIPAKPGESAYWSSNSWGFHSPEFAVAKDPGVIRIVCLGASTTEGQGPETQSYPRDLERDLAKIYGPRHFEVINAGHSGYNIEDIVALFSRRVLPLKPDMVLFYEAANNIQTPNFITHLRVHRSIWRLAHDLLYRQSALFRLVSDQFGWRKTVPSRSNYGLDLSLRRGKASPDFFEDHLKELAQVTRRNGVKLVLSSFVTLAHEGLTLSYEDNRSRYNDLYNGIYAPLVPGDIARIYAHYNLLIRRVADEYHLDFVDLAKDFPRDPRYFPFDIIHLSPKGNEILAHEWATALERRVLPALIKSQQLTNS